MGTYHRERKPAADLRAGDILLRWNGFVHERWFVRGTLRFEEEAVIHLRMDGPTGKVTKKFGLDLPVEVLVPMPYLRKVE